ncbi:MAG: cell division protein FtsK, partial [Rhodospirillaceae bacterium]|nr:cell division protein FtsK [Rhodospirillaceae bacterium]
FFNHITLAATIALPGVAAFVFSLGLPTSDWQKVTRSLMWLNAKLGAYILKGAHHISTRSQNDDYDELVDDAPRAAGTRPRVRKTERTVIKPRAKKKNLIAPKAPKAKTGRKAEAQRQKSFDLGIGSEYKSPPLDLLDTPDPSRSDNAPTPEALEQNAAMLSGVLEDFGIRGEIVKVRPGPVITLYELEPAPGTKSSRIIGLSDDIARSMSAISVRVATVPGRNVIGIELPNQNREMVHLRELLASADFEKSKGLLTMALGKNIGGIPVNVDLARMPHLLIAGTTGSGKSVGLNAMILSLLYQNSPEQCRFIMIDPKMLELSVYDNIPHLLSPVVTDPAKAVVALKWTVREMEERYRSMSQMGVRNITGYNQRLVDATKRGEVMTRKVQTGFDEAGKPVFEEQPLSMDPLPYIVVVVDEMADLMLVAGKEVEGAIQRLAQMARAAGIHIIMATQRPSVDVITGTIKANFPTRISFQVTSKIDSRTILGEQGAERLLGQGDMLYMAGGGRITRCHAPFVSDEEVEEVVSFLKDQGRPDYLDEITEEPITPDMTGPIAGGGNKDDELYDQAVALIAREGKASTSFIQRHLQIGYNRAARIIERMEAEGVVSKANRVGRREVLIGDVSAQAS